MMEEIKYISPYIFTIILMGIIISSVISYNDGYGNIDTFYLEEGEKWDYGNITIYLVDAIRGSDEAIIKIDNDGNIQMVKIRDYKDTVILDGNYKIGVDFSGDYVAQLHIKKYLGIGNYWWDRL